MSGSAAELLNWLDKAAEATKDHPVERALVVHLAQFAGPDTRPIAPIARVTPSAVGLDNADIGPALSQLHRRGFLQRAWVLTMPDDQAEGEETA